VQLAISSSIKHFLTSPPTSGGPAHPTPALSGTFPAQHMAFYGMQWPRSHQRYQRQNREHTSEYRRRARSPGPATWSTPGSRLSPPAAGRAPRRSAAPAAPRVCARASLAGTGPRSHSSGSTPPRSTAGLQNSTTGAHLSELPANTDRQISPCRLHLERAPYQGEHKAPAGPLDRNSTRDDG
jgi:hypothetical protein